MSSAGTLAKSRRRALLAFAGFAWVVPAWAQPAPAPSAEAPPSADETPGPPETPETPEAGADAAEGAGAPASGEPLIERPRPLDALSVDYPQGAEGDASVLLELVVDAEGKVSGATAVTGAEPFASAAIATALGWRFTPARRDGVALAARIRVRVDFTPPVYEELSEEAPPAPPPPGEAVAPAPEPEPEVVWVRSVRPVGVKQLGRGEVREMPGAFGDPYRAIESLPGVTPIASGLPYFFVRGAPPGNVGYFFDRVSVPLLFHVAAGPGVIHPAFIKSVDLYSGAYPARYGRFAGGVVAGERADPSFELHGEASIRLVDAGAFLEVPFADGRGSATLAGRYSYTGAIVSLLAADVSLGYWDYQGRVRYELGDRDALTVFGFGSHDFLEADDSAGQRQEVLDLTFHRLNLSYERALGAAGKLDVTAMLGLDRSGLGGDPDDAEEEDPADLRTKTLGGRVTYEARLSDSFALSAGADAVFTRANVDFNFPDGPDEEEEGLLPIEEVSFPAPGFPEITAEPLDLLEDDRAEEDAEARFGSRDETVAGAWIEGNLDLGRGVTLMPGLRLDLYQNGSGVTLAAEPRLGVRYDLTPAVAITHALGLAHQPPSFAIPVPGLAGTAEEGLQRAIQSSAGVEVQLPARLAASATLFQNVIFDSTDIFGSSALQDSDPSVQSFSDRTTNHSYGLELYLRRPLTARLGGFLSYTLSQSRRSVARLTGPSSFDRRHVLNAALAFDLGRRWRLGARAVVYSGSPAETAYPAAAKDPPRTPWFYRLDWRLEKRWLIGDAGAWWALVLEVLNTTLHEETLQSSCYAYGCREETIGPVTIPSIGVEASF